MPILPLPLTGSAISGGELPVSGGNDVLKEFSDSHRRPEASPVRDDLCASFAVSHTTYQDVAATALAQTDPLYATDDFLVAKALEREVIPTLGEDPEHLRARIFGTPLIVTPDAIVALVDELIAPYTKKQCQLVEPEMDGLYVHDGGAWAWDAFIGAQPRYGDRFYAEDSVENGGYSLSNNQPGGTIISTGQWRAFHLRIPSVDASDTDFAFDVDAVDLILPIGDGSDTSGSESDGTGATSIFSDGNTEEEIFAAIVGGVEAIKGQGISWSVLIDESL